MAAIGGDDVAFFYFQIRKELGFSRTEWKALGPHDQRMYREGLVRYYEIRSGKGGGDVADAPPLGITTRRVVQ